MKIVNWKLIKLEKVFLRSFSFVFFNIILLISTSSAANSVDYVNGCKYYLTHITGPSSEKEHMAWGMYTGMCLGTLNGVASTLRLVGSISPNEIKICFPPDWSNLEGLKVVLAYAEKEPTHVKEFPAAELVVVALTDAYGCAK